MHLPGQDYFCINAIINCSLKGPMKAKVPKVYERHGVSPDPWLPPNKNLIAHCDVALLSNRLPDFGTGGREMWQDSSRGLPPALPLLVRSSIIGWQDSGLFFILSWILWCSCPQAGSNNYSPESCSKRTVAELSTLCRLGNSALVQSWKQ